MSDWEKVEIQALNDYLRWNMFKEPDEGGVYIYIIEDLKIQVKPTGDYNFELTFNGVNTTENALELTGDTIIETIKFWLNNNDPETDRLWEEIYTTKEKNQLSEVARKIIDEIIALGDKKS